MKRNLMLFTLVVMTLFATSSLFSAGIDLTGMGARAQALGGNYRAVSNDWSALYWNPAGMAFTNGWTAGYSNEFIKVNVGYTAGQINTGTQDVNFSATSGSEVNNEPRTYFVPSGGFYYSTGKYAFGLGVWAPFGLGAKWDLLNTKNYNSKYPEFDYDDDLMVIDIHPTFAYKISDKLSVGLGASIISANIMIQKPNFTPNPYVFNPAFAAAAAGLAPTLALLPVYNHLLTDTQLEGDGIGYGANFGIMYKPTETLSIGVSGQYYADVAMEGTVNAKTYFANNPAAHGAIQAAIKPTLDQYLGAGAITAEEYAVLLNYYSGAEMPLATDKKIKTDMPLPMKIGIGVAYTGFTNLLISADVAYTNWDVWSVIDIDDEKGNKYSELVENWENGIRMGVGLEYNLGFGKVRGSYYTEPNAAVEETMSPSIPDFARRNVLIGGIEVPVGPVKLHASFEKILVGDLEVDTWEPTPDLKGYENLAGKYNMNITIIMLGFDYNF